MAFPLPSPAALAGIARHVVGQLVESAAAVATVPVRVLGLLGQAELLVSRITVIVENAEALIRRVEVVTAGAAGVVQGAAVTTEAATGVVARAQTATAEAVALLELYSETLRRAAPLAARFVDDLTPEEVTAAIRLIDQLPALRAHLVDDIMPLLGKLDQVGPDLHALLAVTQDLHLAIVGLPGLKMLRRRGEERVADDGPAAGR